MHACMHVDYRTQHLNLHVVAAQHAHQLTYRCKLSGGYSFIIIILCVCVCQCMHVCVCSYRLKAFAWFVFRIWLHHGHSDHYPGSWYCEICEFCFYMISAWCTWVLNLLVCSCSAFEWLSTHHTDLHVLWRKSGGKMSQEAYSTSTSPQGASRSPACCTELYGGVGWPVPYHCSECSARQKHHS